jgi:hypothetical protein
MLASRPNAEVVNNPAVQVALNQALAQAGAGAFPALSNTNYSINPSIQALTAGASTSQLTISCAVGGTGSGNSFNPVFLFGSDAFTNASKGYTSVQLTSPAQITATGFTNSKNVITFKYGGDTNFATYTVSQSTKGEYPFWLNSLTGNKTQRVRGMQISLSDAADVAQLANTLQTFELDQFGRAVTNDLTQPKDLYQQQTNGIWITSAFEISGRKGFLINVNENAGLQLDIFMYVDPNVYAS